MARLCSDENFPFPVVEELRRLGPDVITLLEAGKAEQALPDESVLDFACSDNRAILTLNRRHFIRLHNVRSNHKGIVVCTFDLDFIGQARRIHEEIEGHEGLSQKLIRIIRP